MLFANGLGRGFFEKRIQAIHIFGFFAICFAAGIFGSSLVSWLGSLIGWWPSYGEARASAIGRLEHTQQVMWPLFWANIAIPFALGIIIRVAKRFSKKAMVLA